MRSRELPRVPVPSSQKQPAAKDMPVDYYHPEYYDLLTVKERADCWDNGVAFPSVEHCQTWEDIQQWVNLPKEEFMQKYGEEVLARYKRPTLVQLERLDKEQRYRKGKRNK